MDKILIAYFSREGTNYVGGAIVNLPVGNTEVAARRIQDLTGGDLFRIKTVRPYAEDYTECTKEAQKELRENARPELAGPLPSMDAYDTVYLGYPNWWGTMPMGVFAFLERCDLSGKRVFPFCTHEGSGMGRSEQDLGRVCPNAKVLPGLAIRGGEVNHAGDEIARWIRGHQEA